MARTTGSKLLAGVLAALALTGVGRLMTASAGVETDNGVPPATISAAVDDERQVTDDTPQGASSWWERHVSEGPTALSLFRPEPVMAGPDLGAIDPSTWLAGSPYRPSTPAFRDRRFVTPPSPWLVDPVTPEFSGEVREVPDHVARRSTWREDCPVTLDELRWVLVTHLGFDGRAHAGELLVHRDAAEGMVEVFRRLYEAQYPIEKMRIAGGRDFTIGPWWHGDDNTTSAFVCRMSTGGTRWSEHAYGKAVDVNPYHNPYLRTARTEDGEDVLIPPGSVHYLDRDDRPGIIHAGDEVTSAFRQELAWTWGGQWRSLLDYMHFSWNDR